MAKMRDVNQAVYRMILIGKGVGQHHDDIFEIAIYRSK